MGLFTPPEDLLIRAMSSMQPQVRLEHCLGSIEGVFKSALKKEPRLLAYLSGYEANYLKKGLVQLSYDYDVTIEYREPAPSSIDDVVLDRGSWDAASILTKGAPREFTLVTSDAARVSEKLTDLLDSLLSSYEGIHGWEANAHSFEKLSPDTVCVISYGYILPQQQLRQLQGKAAFAAKNIWKRILGKSRVPQFVKPFLALSYLTQECCYDQRAFDEVESDPAAVPSDPIPHLAYGPLVENRGICGGLAWAFQTLMEEANIECLCVSGFLKEDLKTSHMWNLVKIDGQYYHVDPTWGIRDSGVPVSALMQPDSMMTSTHLWKTEQYPAARGMRFDYDYIEDFLAENGNEFLDDGANETYFFPDEIVD